MPELIDNSDLFSDAHRITGLANDLLERLDDIEKDTPAKVETYAVIKLVIETQSEAIRQLVEQQAQISDKLNDFFAKHPQ